MALLYILHCTSYSSSTAENCFTSVILELYFGFDFDHINNIEQVILHQAVEFHPNRTFFSRLMILYRFSRWRPPRRNFTSGFGLTDVSPFSRSMSISKLNFIVIAQSIHVWVTGADPGIHQGEGGHCGGRKPAAGVKFFSPPDYCMWVLLHFWWTEMDFLLVIF